MTEQNNTPTPPPTEGWLQELRNAPFYKSAPPSAQAGIEHFIEQALAEQKARMVEVVGGMKDEGTCGHDQDGACYAGKYDGEICTASYNTAIDDIIKALSK